MDNSDWLAGEFEASRGRLRAVAYRMLGSLSEAEDAVQETWLRLSRAGTDGVENLGGWMTTIVARVCLDQLRSRKARREEPFGEALADEPRDGADPEHEALLADSVGLALLVVLDTLAPPERLAFVLHDLFAVPFDEIAEIVGRSPAATRQLASRARRRVQGTDAIPEVERARQREVVNAFLAASREGDFDALVAVLDPDVVLHGEGRVVRGAAAVAGQARMYARRAPFTRMALVGGSVGLIFAPYGRLQAAMHFTFADGAVVALDVFTDHARMRELDLALSRGLTGYRAVRAK